MKTVALYAMDTMADWEYSYIVAGLTMAAEFAPDRYRLVVASDGPVEEVTTLGRLRLRPDTTLDQLDDVAVLILPGGATWATGHDAVLDMARSLLEADTPVAAICGATLGLARTGILDNRPHTSNDPGFLTTATEYKGADHYVESRTVTDSALITAPGTAPVDFSKAVFEALELFPQPVIDAWHGLYTTGDKKYYDQLNGTSA
ncbi:glutamine amidotransferase [Rhodococcoides trifolii]|uniref:Glutamine amidotransferase n=1 Tax=Rhodococcoides trifolii TaxID=908250 RepID=A0A917G643_9NOCA|nr:DJ-1/PfpI family protein [Rhodococcus trifolii]GGG23704.1 glutamine amidotransferase [Rhodococcus trifolii]